MSSDDHDIRGRAVDAVAALRVALLAAIETIGDDLDFTADVIAGLQDGRRVGDLMTELNVTTFRQRLTDAIASLETKRLEARRHLFTMMVSDGASIGEVARTWGISRQLASRILRDAPEPAG